MFRKLQSRNGRRGSILLLYTLLVGVLCCMAGLAIDISLIYITQAQLQTAVNGAANSAIRLIGSGADTTEIATEYVKANIPTGLWFTNGLNVTNVSLTNNSTNTYSTASVSAKVKVPTLFMRWLGDTSAVISATGTATAWNVQPCTLSYPTGSAPSLSSVIFNEAIDLQGYGPTFVLPHGKIIAWYNDEHAMTLGVYQVYVTNAAGQTTLTDYSSQFTFNNGALSAGTDSLTLPVGTTALTGDQAGTDTAAWSSSYGYQSGRPMWPALFITDITSNTTSTSGDWQQGGTAAIAPNVVYGTWKGAVKCVNYSTTNVGCPPSTVTSSGSGSTTPAPGSAMVGSGSAAAGSGSATVSSTETGTPAPGSGSGSGAVASGGYPGITYAVASDPSSNCTGSGTSMTCTGVIDTPLPSGWSQGQSYGAEVVWYIDNLGLRPGHAYRIQIMIHDGDQNQSGGDTGEGCIVAKY